MKSDHQLQLELLAELSLAPSVKARDIGVVVKDGIVTLAGHVASYAQKVDAERAAFRVFGVKALPLAP